MTTDDTSAIADTEQDKYQDDGDDTGGRRVPQASVQLSPIPEGTEESASTAGSVTSLDTYLKHPDPALQDCLVSVHDDFTSPLPDYESEPEDKGNRLHLTHMLPDYYPVTMLPPPRKTTRQHTSSSASCTR